MRIKLLFSILAIIILNGCTKTNEPVNFNCKINGNYIQGTGVTYFTNAPTFQLSMTGPNNQNISILWYNIDSSAGIKTQIHPGTYQMPAQALPPFVASGVYTSAYGAATYSTGSGSIFSGSVTITNNTGVDGVMSGTFNFTGQNPNSPYDTVYVTQGTFTNVRVGVS